MNKALQKPGFVFLDLPLFGHNARSRLMPQRAGKQQSPVFGRLIVLNGRLQFQAMIGSSQNGRRGSPIALAQSKPHFSNWNTPAIGDLTPPAATSRTLLRVPVSQPNCGLSPIPFQRRSGGAQVMGDSEGRDGSGKGSA